GFRGIHAQTHASQVEWNGVGVEQLDVIGHASGIRNGRLVAGQDFVQHRTLIGADVVGRAWASRAGEVNEVCSPVWQAATGDSFGLRRVGDSIEQSSGRV